MPDQQKVLLRQWLLGVLPCQILLQQKICLTCICPCLKKQREQTFSDTAHAAEITGLSVRTIQLWIERGVVHAVPVGKKYQVELGSLRNYLKRQVDRRA